ncbi:MAG TPA: cyclic dehypoxanthinyl futalosine synthase, partial [Candidatus Saccharimonadales bacterium]|nr:cyclic dehypoxanthinyl futalosine synthase [Candidatus Saccharimonadales bacterium]
MSSPESGRFEEIAERVRAGARITPADAESLFAHEDLPALGDLADTVRRRLHPEPVVTYVVGCNLNYTNVCWVRCKFCAFYRPPGDPEGYVLSRDQMGARIQALVDIGGREVLLQGGVNPALKLDDYLEMLRWIKTSWDVHLHAFSPVEVTYIAKISNLTLEQTLGRLSEAGLDTLPGAGGEILADRVRREISPLKDTSDEWIEVMRTCHRLGIRTSATMMYGSVETMAERVEHLQRIRDLQDETGGFNSFIAWSFVPDATELAGLKRASGFDYLRTVAVSRIFLDNVKSFQASWVTQGAKIAQVSLRFGVNDFGSTVLEENVVSAAGGTHRMDLPEMIRLIEDAGFRAEPRDTNYNRLPVPSKEEIHA